MKPLVSLTLAALLTAGLAACGGGDDNPGPASYTVTPSVNGSGGTISPADAVPVQSGATTTFTLTPSTGYSRACGCAALQYQLHQL